MTKIEKKKKKTEGVQGLEKQPTGVCLEAISAELEEEVRGTPLSQPWL